MKVKNGFNLREVCGEHIIVAEGDENIDFSNIISMNESSAYLWGEVQKMGSFTVDSLVKLLCEQYEIDEDTARKDATILAAQWGTAGIIEGEDIPENLTASAPAEETGTVVTAAERNNNSVEGNKKPGKKGFFKRLFG